MRRATATSHACVRVACVRRCGPAFLFCPVSQPSSCSCRDVRKGQRWRCTALRRTERHVEHPCACCTGPELRHSPTAAAARVQVQQQNHLAVADFPKPQAFADILGQFGLEKVPKVADKHIKAVEDALSSDIPRLIKQFTSPY